MSVPPRLIELAVILPVAIKCLRPLISLLESTIIALDALTDPSVTLCNVLISEALEVTSSPANLRPEDVVLWEAISSISGPLVVPILVTPVSPWVNTFWFIDCPGVIPSRTLREVWFKVVVPKTRFPSTVKLLVTWPDPLIVILPSVILRLPCESKVIDSVAIEFCAVKNPKVVELFVELKSPSDFATIEAEIKLAAPPVASSGAWNSILPRISLTWISLDDDWSFKIEPFSDLDVKLLTEVIPETFILLVLIVPEPAISLNPEILLLLSTTTLFPADTEPATTPVSLLISWPDAVTSTLSREIELVDNFPERLTLLNPVIFLWSSTITTFPFDTEPGIISSNLLISSAIAVMFTPPMSSVCALNSPWIVILFIPEISLFSSRTIALEASAVPGLTESRYPSSALEIELPPTVREPLTDTLAEKTESLLASNLPTFRSANPSTVTDPAVLPSSVFVATNAKLSVDSCQISDWFLVLVVIPSPLVNTIPKSWVEPILPSPNFITLSVTV